MTAGGVVLQLWTIVLGNYWKGWREMWYMLISGIYLDFSMEHSWLVFRGTIRVCVFVKMLDSQFTGQGFNNWYSHYSIFCGLWHASSKMERLAKGWDGTGLQLRCHDGNSCMLPKELDSWFNRVCWPKGLWNQLKLLSDVRLYIQCSLF